MDPLSAATGILGIIELANEVVSFIQKAKGAKDDRNRLCREIRDCESVLKLLKDKDDEYEQDEDWTMKVKFLDTPLRRLREALENVRIKVQPKTGVMEAFKWPLKAAEVQAAIYLVEREKSSLNLVLTLDSRVLQQKIAKSNRRIENKGAELHEMVVEGHQSNQNGFRELKYDLSSTQHCIESVRYAQEHQKAQDRRMEIMAWLTSVEYTSRYQASIEKRQEGTGMWLINSEKFQMWFRSERKTLLCYGMPGAGKTILTSIVIEYIQNEYQLDPTVELAYIYCNFKEKNAQNIDTLLSSLLMQLCRNQDPLEKRVIDLFDHHIKRNTRPSWREISDVLYHVVLSFSKVIICIDALDECQVTDGCRKRLLKVLFELQKKCHLQLFATSIELPEILGNFGADDLLEVRASNEDVEMYLSGQMLMLHNFVAKNEELQEEIKTSIIEAVQGMFLLARLHFNYLISKNSPKKIRRALKTLPQGPEEYKAAYDSTMERIEGQLQDDKELAMQVLSWITCAKRPLTTLELQHALSVEPEDENLDEENFPDVDDMIRVCAGLVTIDKESKIVRLVHYTTQEYFEKAQERWFPQAELEMATVCITYILFSPSESIDRADKYELYDYAMHYWAYHSRTAPDSVPQAMKFLKRAEKVQAALEYLTGKNKIRLAGTTGIHLAVYLGVVEIVSHCIQNGMGMDDTDSNGQTPLFWAINYNRFPVVHFLISEGANITDSDSTDSPLLYLATLNQNIEIVQLLLDVGVTIDSQDTWGVTALHRAAQYGYILMVKFLLGRGAAVDLSDNKGLTALSYAVMYESKDVVHFLLDNKASANVTTSSGKTALFFAVSRRHEPSVIKKLFDNGAHIDCFSNHITNLDGCIYDHIHLVPEEIKVEIYHTLAVSTPLPM